MFITSKEKEWMMASILHLERQVRELTEKFAESNKTYTLADAPWGFKRDGTPRKRPGRTPKEKVQS